VEISLFLREKKYVWLIFDYTVSKKKGYTEMNDQKSKTTLAGAQPKKH